jgi:hypothetical protein
MPKNIIEQIFGIKIPKKTQLVRPFDFINKDRDEEILPQLDIVTELQKPRVQLSDVRSEGLGLPTALRRTPDEDMEMPLLFAEEAPTMEFDATVETEGQKFTRQTGEFLQSPEFSYMLAALGASIGGKDSVGGMLGQAAIEQIQSSVFEDYMSALDAGEDVSKIPGVSLLPVAMKSRALAEKRAEGKLVIEEREQTTEEKSEVALSKYRDAASQELYSNIEKRLPDLETLEFQRGTKRMEMEFRLEAVKLKGEFDTSAYQNQIKLYDRMSKAVDEKIKDEEGIMHRMSPGQTTKLRQDYWREELTQSKGMSPEWFRLHFPDLPEDSKDIQEGEMYMAIKDGKWVVVQIEADGYKVVKEIQ